jgi:opacity protein-like surface antigen
MEQNGQGTKAIGMANAFVAVADNCWAIDYNPAGLTKLNTLQCTLFFIPEQFGLNELKTTALAVAIPFSTESIGAEIRKFGFELYTETEFGLAYSRKFDGNISGGITVHYSRIDIARYGTTGTVFLHGGLMVQMSDQVKLGFCLRNLAATTLGSTGEKIPQQVSLGTSWYPLNNVILSVEIEKDVRFPARLKFGVEQQVLSLVAFRAGIADNPDTYSIGIGVRYSIVGFGYATYSHPDLGWTHQIEISLQMDKDVCGNLP